MTFVSRPGRSAAAPLALAAMVGLLAAGLVVRVASAGAPALRYTIGTGPAAGTVYDTKTKLTWQQAVSGTTYAWADAKKACQAASTNGGGWRLPTAPELLSLVDFLAASGPFIDTTAFPNTPTKAFWSATPVVGSSTTAWPVDFGSGDSNGVSVTTASYVRCVR
jgi:Protein of unknown function (DUF1566)